MYSDIDSSFKRLYSYCLAEDFKGFDPYDSLNSKVFRATPLKKWNFARLVWIQLFKRSPVNLRSIFLIRKEYNPKGIALFLAGYCNIYRMQKATGTEDVEKQETVLKKISQMASELTDNLKTDGYSGMCWGYNFDWESRAFFLPKYTPTIVVSTFVANALLDAHEILSDEKYLKAARSTCDFILKDLNRDYDEKGNFIFSYSKFDHSSVFNGSLLGSRLLARLYSITGEKILFDEARRSVEYVCRYQNGDGSWTYGRLPFHQWIDSFHTGFNLECISEYMKFSGDNSYTENLRRGFGYYIDTFFTPEGVSKYYNTALYPVDIHAPAQLVVTAVKLGRFKESSDLLKRVLVWTITNMQSRKGFFYYQIKKYYKIKIAYMRWSQAWMFYGLSTFLLAEKGD
jgi:hypothetical protein